MATDINKEVFSITAAQDLNVDSTRFKVITFGGTIGAAADTARWAGVNVTAANSGEQASAAYFGVFKASFGAAVTTPGWPLKVANSGWLTAAASGDTTIGRAVAAVSSGDIATGMFNFTNPSIWHG
jgi:hypothetical protein